MSKEHGRERAPPAETEEMINSAIAEAATAFGVPAGSIKKRNIRIANRPNSAQNPTELFCTTSGKSVIYGLGPVIWSPTNAPSYSPRPSKPVPRRLVRI
jgi:hypothetical protein